jgi:endonuclease YncB( thermonuclease family)
MNSFKRAVLPALILVLSLLLPNHTLAGEYQVTRVIDGDTIKVDDGSKKITVRMVGIDAPETSKSKNDPGQPFSQRATKHLSSLVLNQTVDIKSYGLDRDGRVLGEVFLEDRNINLEMVKAGYAEVYRGKTAPGLDLEQYRKAEENAKKANRGMWVLGDKYISPREWRRSKAD